MFSHAESSVYDEITMYLSTTDFLDRMFANSPHPLARGFIEMAITADLRTTR